MEANFEESDKVLHSFFNVSTIKRSDLNSFGIRISELELEIWLSEMSKGEVEEHSNFFSIVITEAIKFCHLYNTVLFSLQKSPEKYIEEQNLLAIACDDDNEMDTIDNVDICVIATSESFSCLVLSAIDILKRSPSEDNVQYFSSVVQHFIPALISPSILIDLILSSGIKLTNDVRNFMKSYLTENSGNSNDEANNLLICLDTIFKVHKCPKIKYFIESLPDMLKDDTDSESICRQILYYIKTEKYKSNQEKRPKHLVFFCNLLIELLKIWYTKEIILPFKFLLCHPFLIESYTPFVDTDCLNEVIITALVICSKLYNLFEFMEPYCHKTIETFKSFASIGNTDVSSPFDIFISSPFFFTYSVLEDTICCCVKLYINSNESIVDLTIKLLNLIIILTDDTHLPKEYTIKRLTSLLQNLDNNQDQEECAKLSELIQIVVSKYISSLKIKHLNAEVKKNILSCKALIPVLRCELLSVVNLMEIKKFLLQENFDFELEVPFIALLTDKSYNNSTIDSFKQFSNSIIKWAKCSKSKANQHCEQIIKYFLSKNIIGCDEAKDIANLWVDVIIYQNELPPSHILNMYYIFKHLGQEFEHKFLQICMICVQKFYTRMSEDNKKNIAIIANAPQKLILFKESLSYKAKDSQETKLPIKPFLKQVLKESLTDRIYGKLYLNCIAQLLPQLEKKEYVYRKFFKILCSHSEFSKLMSSAQNIKLKEEVLKLIVLILKEYPDMCKEKHIPLLLTSYHASTTSCDQYNLKLLQIYNGRNCLSKFPPVMYGHNAETFFTSKQAAKNDFNLLESTTSTNLLLLINSDKVVKTAKRFDDSLNLEVTRFIEQEKPHEIYDQRYLLMLGAFITSYEGGLNEKLLIKSKLICIAVAALTSKIDSVWETGALILNNLNNAFQSQRKYERKYKQFIKILGHSLNGKKIKLPFIFAQLLIEMLDSMNNEVSIEFNTYIFKDVSMNFNPMEQLKLWLNPIKKENANTLQRSVIRVIGRSIRSDADWKYLLQDDIISHLLCLSLSTSLDINLRNEIFKLFAKICKNSKLAVKYLIEHVNFLSLFSVMRNDVEMSTHSDKDSILKELEIFFRFLDKSNKLSAKNMPTIKFPNKRRRMESCIEESIAKIPKINLIKPKIKEETDDHFDESMYIDD